MAARIDNLTPILFLDGPTEFLSKSICTALIAEPHFHEVFADNVVDYDKEDFSMRELPALRVYGFTYTKEHESHYINGDIKIDIILPAMIRREETEEIQGRLAAALLQQFRRPNFFQAMEEKVPGLNELGKVFSVDKSLGYQNDKTVDECPTTQITLNFRIDLKQWDAYLEEQGRTKEDPFDVTLKNLKRIATKIQGIRVDADITTKDVELDSTQIIGG